MPSRRAALTFFRVSEKLILRATRSTRDPAILDGVLRLAPDDVVEMLDVGSSDGRLAHSISTRLGVRAMGVDVQVHDKSLIPVQPYDGQTLPFESNRFRLITIVDVLHHADDPRAVLKESLRVLHPQGRIVIKDHARKGAWSGFVLSSMDIISNLGMHLRAAGRYLSLEEWEDIFADLSAEVSAKETPFRVHNNPWRLIARDAYHVLWSLEKRS
jgi:SAM-dependent methyltransferase